MTTTLKAQLSGLTPQVGLIDFYKTQIAKLPKKDSTLTICDLDDTLFSREEQLQREPELRARRGYE